MVEEIKKDDFDSKAKQGKVIIDFYAEWCGPCQMMKPAFEKVAGETEDIKFFKANVESDKALADEYAVRSIPTLVFLNNGKEEGRNLGMLSEDALKEKIKEIFG